jgi:hypothetical protein
MNLPLNLVGTRSIRVPNCLRQEWGRGGTCPYRVKGSRRDVGRGSLVVRASTDGRPLWMRPQPRCVHRRPSVVEPPLVR